MGVNIRSVVFINGIVICCLAVAMAFPMLIDLIAYSGKCAGIFAPSIVASVFLGGLMILSCRSHTKLTFTRNDAFLLVVFMWLGASIICAFPFYIYQEVNLKFMSALFESVSGLTTTGATIYPDVEILPKALMMWRFILHFIGGVGIVAIGIIVLPIMRIGGMQLFLAENSDKSPKILPRTAQIIKLFIGLYIFLIAILSFSLKLTGMSLFDSICHGISAISTGGFSTKNLGIESFGKSKIEIVMSIGMFAGGITFLEIIRSFKSGLKTFFSNQQTLGYFKLVAITISVPLFFAIINKSGEFSMKTIASYIFKIISAITTTGIDFSESYLSSNMILILLAVIGGCSGSTTGGIKIFRIQILYSILKNHLKKMVSPFDVSIPKYQNKRIDEGLATSVISFIWLLVIVFITSVLVLELLTGIGSAASAYSTVSCLFNLGYGADFVNFPPAAKFVLICDMIIGRLEVIPIFIVFGRTFWIR